MTRLLRAVQNAWPDIAGCLHTDPAVKAELGAALDEALHHERPFVVIKDRDQDSAGRSVPPIVSGDTRGVLVTSAIGFTVALGPETARQIGQAVDRTPLRKLAGGR